MPLKPHWSLILPGQFKIRRYLGGGVRDVTKCSWRKLRSVDETGVSSLSKARLGDIPIVNRLLFIGPRTDEAKHGIVSNFAKPHCHSSPCGTDNRRASRRPIHPPDENGVKQLQPHRPHAIRLNTDVTNKPPECLEYFVNQEMIHIHEVRHNARFRSPIVIQLPNWEHLRQLLNDLPVRHEEWHY